MAKETELGLDENVEGALTYVLMWVSGIIFLLLEKDNKFIKFHAMQSIITFLPLTIISWLLIRLGRPSFGYGYGGTGIHYSPGIPVLLWLGWIIGLVMFVVWLLLMFKAYQGEKYKLPVVGDLAENQV